MAPHLSSKRLIKKFREAGQSADIPIAPLECKLCGMKKSGSSKMFPCDDCKMNFPSAKRCSSCGRIFPCGDKFKMDSPYCISCDVRKMKKKIGQLKAKAIAHQTSVIEDISSEEFESMAAEIEENLSDKRDNKRTQNTCGDLSDSGEEEETTTLKEFQVTTGLTDIQDGTDSKAENSGIKKAGTRNKRKRDKCAAPCESEEITSKGFQGSTNLEEPPPDKKTRKPKKRKIKVSDVKVSSGEEVLSGLLVKLDGKVIGCIPFLTKAENN